MKRFCTLAYTLALLTFATLTFLPNTFAQGAAPDNMVRLVYFLPSDRPARPERIAALRQLTKDAQAFYAEQMESHGYGRKTFNIETDANGTPVVHRIHGKFRESHYYTGTSDYKIWEELFEHFDDLEHVYFIAADLSQETFNDGGSCGLGGSSFVPSGGITPVFLFTPRSGAVAIRHRDITQRQEVIGGSLIIPASGDCFEDNRGFQHKLRVTTHELGHAFGLEHDFREGRWDNNTVMGGRGFHLSSCAAEWLSVSHFFNTHPISANAPGAIQLLSKPTYTPAGINLRFQVTDAEGLHQAQLMVPENLENGSWGPYRLFDCKRLNGKTGTVEFISPELAMDPVDRVALQIIDVNGNITWATFLTDIVSLLPRPKVVSIPDRNLAAAVRKALGLGANAPITDQAMRRLTRLEARESQIQDLTGLEHATQLTELYLYQNQIRNISPLAGLTRLKRLDVDVNQISNITPLAELTQLEGLYLGANQINNQDIQHLSNLTQLRWLSLYGNQISDIKPLASLTKLQGLWLDHNQIRDVSPLAGLVNLETLHLKNNPIQDTSLLASLTKLRDVNIDISDPQPNSGNVRPEPTVPVPLAEPLPVPVEDVVSIPDAKLAAAVREALGLGAKAPITKQAMQRLTRLHVDGHGITNIIGLEYAIQLERLNLGNNRISDYGPLARLQKLKRLTLWANGISDLSVLSPLPQLEFLDLNWNQISDVSPLAGFTNLKELWLQGNKLANTSTLFQLHNGTFPSDEEVEVIEERDNLNRTYMLLVFGSLDLKVRINPDAVIFRSANSTVLVEASQRPPMYWIDADAGTLQRLIGDEVENLVPTVKNATSLAVDMMGGKLYWTEKTGDRTGRIRGANLDGTNVKLVKDLTSVAHSIVLDTVNGKLYLTNSWGKIQRMNLDGSNFQPNFITNLNAPRHITLDATGGQLYWTEQTDGTTGKIRRANLDGSNVQLVKDLASSPRGLALDTANKKLYLTNAYGKVQRLNVDGSNFQSNLITELDAPTEVSIDVASRKIYWAERGSIRRADFSGANIQDLVTNLGSPGNIVLGISATPPVPTDTPAPSVEPAGDTTADVNQDQKVNKTDLLLVVTALGESPSANPNFDVNADGTVDIADLLLVIEALDDPVAAAAPSFGETLTALDPGQLALQIDILRAESDGSIKYAHAIAFFQSLLASIHPTETQLLANYPNPFNPETWIPYQLAKVSDVRITIYDGRGVVVRQLVLGHQAPGFYTSRSRAAYWDGRNALGEGVASGIYFYQLQTDNVSSLRKMLILK